MATESKKSYLELVEGFISAHPRVATVVTGVVASAATWLTPLVKFLASALGLTCA